MGWGKCHYIFNSNNKIYIRVKKFTFTSSIFLLKKKAGYKEMGLNITTDKETEWKELTITPLDNLIFLMFRDDADYYSYFPFAYNDKTAGERFVGYAGAIKSNDIQDDSFDNPFPKGVDVYICPNGMKSPYKRTAENLINIQNLIIDIDSHQSKLSIDKLNEHISDFESKLIDRLIIRPNFVNRTGRGLHLWFCIEACHVSLNKICMSVIDMLCTDIEQIMKSLNEEELSIDRASSMKLNGLFRLPYTYNTKAKRWGEGYLIHEEICNINELQKRLTEKGFKSPYFSSKKKKKKVGSSKYKFSDKIKNNDYTPCLIHRKKFIEYLLSTREIEVGSRDIMMFAMYSTVVMLMSREQAQEYCTELNATFKKPLHTYELRAIFKEIDKKRHRFTVQKFFGFVNATEEEKAWFNKLTIKEQRKQKKRNAKIERDNKVKDMRANGLSIVAIGKEMNLSRPTIYKILNS